MNRPIGIITVRDGHFKKKNVLDVAQAYQNLNFFIVLKKKSTFTKLITFSIFVVFNALQYSTEGSQEKR